MFFKEVIYISYWLMFWSHIPEVTGSTPVSPTHKFRGRKDLFFSAFCVQKHALNARFVPVVIIKNIDFN
jgi:hypothetical protein